MRKAKSRWLKGRYILLGAVVAAAPFAAFSQNDGMLGFSPIEKPKVPGETSVQAPFPQAAPEAPAGSATASLQRLTEGLAALDNDDIAATRAMRDAMPEGLDRRILTWAMATKAGDRLPSGEVAAIARSLSGWPGARTFRRNSERAMLRENPAPDVVVNAFGGTRPQTPDGIRLLVRAYRALGDEKAASDLLLPFWRTEKLDSSVEIAYLAEFGPMIPKADHRIRMERMLYADRVKSAERIAELAGAPALAKAWAAVVRRQKDAGALLDAVPEAERSPGYLFARARLLRRQGKDAEAAAVMLKAPDDGVALVDPDAWWSERRQLSRELLDLGDARTAYRLVAAHAAERPANVADAEFHAGWYALRSLGDAAAASRHFARITEIAEGPISLSRAWYWLGRAADAGGPGKAGDYYAQAAEYGTTFYGQIAAAKLGRSTIDIGQPESTAKDRETFLAREPVRAIQRLEAAGATRLADTLYRELAENIDSPGEMALLTGMAEARGNHYLALRMAKQAASRGVAVGALAHPVGAIPDEAEISVAGKALAYAIARQESEFNVGAVSSAGARGLLQLMPATAKEMARRNGLPYSQQRLTSDAAYNATLGAAFLGDQLGRFDGSYILTFAGYNAGPRRARDWIARYGDPRGKDIETVIDWIERIPFTETRTYVQRVMENYQVYKMRLSGSFDIVGDLTRGR